MCELLGMECNVPTDIVFSFTGFAMRGGKTGPHADGWGVALYDGKFAQSFLEPKPACTSAMAEYIRKHPIKTLLAPAETGTEFQKNYFLALQQSPDVVLLHSEIMRLLR